MFTSITYALCTELTQDAGTECLVREGCLEGSSGHSRPVSGRPRNTKASGACIGEVQYKKV